MQSIRVKASNNDQNFIFLSQARRNEDNSGWANEENFLSQIA